MKTDWVGKEWAGLLFPRGKNGPAHSFPGEKTDWGGIPACYTGIAQPGSWPRGYKTCFMLNSTEHEISTAQN